MQHLPPGLRSACLNASKEAHRRLAASAAVPDVLFADSALLPRPVTRTIPWEGLRRRRGLDPEPPRCVRHVSDGAILASREEERLLLAALRSVASTLPETSAGDLSFSLPLVEEEENNNNNNNNDDDDDDNGNCARVRGSTKVRVVLAQGAAESLLSAAGDGDAARAVGLVSRVLERMRRSVAECFAVEDASLVQPAGVLVSRLSAPPPPPAAAAPASPSSPSALSSWIRGLLDGTAAASSSASSSSSLSSSSSEVGYWNPHVDKASRCLYDFTSILYLSTNGEDFQGGRFRFLDDDRGKGAGAAGDVPVSDSDGDGHQRLAAPAPAPTMSTGAQPVVVVPRVGRFVAFSSGVENVHHVERVTAGERFTFSVWFTHGEGSPDAVALFRN